MNSPVSIGSGRLRIVGTVIIGDRGTSVIQYVQASVNGLGYGSVTSLSSGRDLGTTQTIYDWYHDFDPSSGDSSLSPSTSNYTIKFQTSDFNADLNYLFYFQPFTLKSVKTLGLNQTIYFNVNKNQLQKIKDNVSHFEVWSKLTSTSSWTKYIDSILPNQIDSNGDVYVTKSISSLTSLPTRYKVLAVDNWGNSQESNILSFVSSPLPVGILQPTPFLTQF